MLLPILLRFCIFCCIEGIPGILSWIRIHGPTAKGPSECRSVVVKPGMLITRGSAVKESLGLFIFMGDYPLTKHWLALLPSVSLISLLMFCVCVPFCTWLTMVIFFFLLRKEKHYFVFSSDFTDGFIALTFTWDVSLRTVSTSSVDTFTFSAERALLSLKSSFFFFHWYVSVHVWNVHGRDRYQRP